MISKKLMLLGSLSFFALSGTGYGAYEYTKNDVDVVLDGENISVRTHSDTVGEVLESLDVSVKDYDYLSHDLEQEINDGSTIEWIPASTVKLVLDGSEETVHSTSKTVGEFLKERDITVGEHDYLSVESDEALTDGLEIVYIKAIDVNITDGKDKSSLAVLPLTVGELLEREEIALNEHDIVSPDREKVLEHDDEVVITRVEISKVKEEESINYSTVTKKDSSMKKGTQKVVTEGAPGKLQKIYEVRKENGEIVSKDLLEEKVVSQPVNKVIAVGTKVIAKPVSRGKSETKKEFYVTATSYTAHCNGCSGYTSTGFNLKNNPNAKVIAVDPSVIPIGTKVYVEGYGYAVALDKGKNIKGNRIDVFFPNKNQAYKWGRKQVKIKIL